VEKSGIFGGTFHFLMVALGIIEFDVKRLDDYRFTGMIPRTFGGH